MYVTKQLQEGERKMKTHFVRKLNNLEQLKELTELILEEEETKDSYKIIKEIKLNATDFKAFSEDFFKDWDWLTSEDGGRGRDGKIRCTRVSNSETGEAVLVNNEGFSYARYTALEN